MTKIINLTANFDNSKALTANFDNAKALTANFDNAKSLSANFAGLTPDLITFQQYYDFTGQISGSTYTDGLGVLDLYQANGSISISGNRLLVQASPQLTFDVGIVGDPVPRAAGVVMYVVMQKQLASDLGMVGFTFNNTVSVDNFNNVEHMYYYSSRAFSSFHRDNQFFETDNTDSSFFFILLNDTAIGLHTRSGEYVITDIPRLTELSVRTTLYPVVSTNTTNFSIGTLRVTDPISELSSYTDFVTDEISGSVTAGATFNNAAGSAFIQCKIVTLPSSGRITINAWKQDDNNKWQLQVDSAGVIYLNRVVAGSVVNVSTAGSISAGQELMWRSRPFDTFIYVYANRTLRIFSTAMTIYRDEVDGDVESLGTGGAISDLRTYPGLIPTGNVKDKLDQIVAG